MSRIIAGLAGSIKLNSAAKATRPTSDRLKESVFAKLESMGVIEGSRVLDLFSGTGALGLEAASRGAASVTLVEKDNAALSVIEGNVRRVQKALGGKARIAVTRGDALSYLRSSNEVFDIVFLDPPYSSPSSLIQVSLDLLKRNGSFQQLAIIERSSRTEKLLYCRDWSIVWERIVGESLLQIIEWGGGSPNTSA